MCHLRDDPYMNDGEVIRYVRATILRLIGGELFSDKTDHLIHNMYTQFVTDLCNVRAYS